MRIKQLSENLGIPERRLRDIVQRIPGAELKSLHGNGRPPMVWEIPDGAEDAIREMLNGGGGASPPPFAVPPVTPPGEPLLETPPPPTLTRGQHSGETDTAEGETPKPSLTPCSETPGPMTTAAVLALLVMAAVFWQSNRTPSQS